MASEPYYFSNIQNVWYTGMKRRKVKSVVTDQALYSDAMTVIQECASY